MSLNNTCSGTLGAELKACGMNFCTTHALDFTKDSLILSWGIPKGSESNFFPLMTKEEILDFFWYQNYSVCVKLENRIAWIQDQDNYVEFRNDDDAQDYFLETDYMVKLLIILLKTRYMTISVVNNFFNRRTREWLESMQIKTEDYEPGGNS